MESEKKQKIELAERVWEEYLKGKSINKIAKKLNINKSVVSNIINYTLPEFYQNAQETCLDNISNLKTEYNKILSIAKNLKNRKEELENKVEKEKEILLYTLTFVASLVAIYLSFFPPFHSSNIFLTIFSLLVPFVATFGIYYLTKKLL